jgi:hypothetical protein
MTWPKLSQYIADEIAWWAYCGADIPCVHHARLDLTAIIATYGDIRADQLKRRLTCRCGHRGARISLIPMSPPRAYLAVDRARERQAAREAARAGEAAGQPRAAE